MKRYSQAFELAPLFLGGLACKHAREKSKIASR
jgi:hypothetical protein